MKKEMGLSIAICSVVLLSACNRHENVEPKIGAEVRQAPAAAPVEKIEKPAETMGTTGTANTSENERDTYLKSAREEIDKLRAKLDEMQEKGKAKAKDTKPEAQAVWEKENKVMKDELGTIESNWEKLKSTSAEAWQQAKTDLGNSIDKLKEKINKM